MKSELRKDVASLDAVDTQKSARICMGRARYKRVNRRRAELIYAGVGKDDPELAELQRCVFRIVELAHPAPPPDPRLNEVLKRLGEDSL